ncbi:GNAT family N-acetyltransferase [Aquicoccus sp. SCR17]|nr:GNAT family N-acetyltransferase [Carideicomes alvinocaridis]
MVAAHDAFRGIDRGDDARAEALAPLLEGSPHGVAYLIGPRRSPVGFLVASFGYSLDLGGIDASIDAFWIREAVRGRGMGTELLAGLAPALARHGVKALHFELDEGNERARRLYERNHFRPRDGHCLMTRLL